LSVRRLPILLAAVLVLAAAAPAAVFEPREFASEAERDTFHRLTEELRCLVCQNQSIAESDAELAGDLREQVHRMLREGASEEAIVAFMVERYGDFVRYKPPLSPATVLLWFGPFLALLAALGWLVYRLRAGPRPSAPALSPEQRRRLDELLDKAEHERPPGEREE